MQSLIPVIRRIFSRRKYFTRSPSAAVNFLCAWRRRDRVYVCSCRYWLCMLLSMCLHNLGADSYLKGYSLFIVQLTFMTSLFPYSDDIKTSSIRITSSFYLCQYVDKGKIMRILMRIDAD